MNSQSERDERVEIAVDNDTLLRNIKKSYSPVSDFLRTLQTDYDDFVAPVSGSDVRPSTSRAAQNNYPADRYSSNSQHNRNNQPWTSNVSLKEMVFFSQKYLISTRPYPFFRLTLQMQAQHFRLQD